MPADYYTRHSDATTASRDSFGDSTISDFDPEHEALASTRQIDSSHELPEIRGSARKNRDSDAQDDADFAIDTSALHRAFPDFSQVHSSEEDDDMSIEVGRGAKTTARQLDDSRTSVMSFENSVRSSSPAVKLDYPSPQAQSKLRTRTTSRRVTSGADNLRKDAQLRRASQAQKENVEPQVVPRPRNPTPATAQGNDQRRTFSDIHAKVRDTYDGSFIADERPSNVPVNKRTTRFGSARVNDIQARVAEAVDKASYDVYGRDSRGARMDSNTRNSANFTQTSNTFADTGTHQSFLLPDLPNLSELVSGVYDNGTPVFPGKNKSRTTRFVSPPHDGGEPSYVHNHRPVDAVPIPEDEKALFVSLRLLQDKVAELELSRSETEKRLEDMREENAMLKADKARRQKDQYNRLRYYGSDEDEYGHATRKLSTEKNRLESANYALQNSLEIANRKVDVHESALKTLKREHDMAVSQLGVAYLNSQDLKAENESLRQENAELKAQVTKLLALTRKGKARDEGTTRSERGMDDEEAADDEGMYTQQSADTTRQSLEEPTKPVARRSSSANRQGSQAKVSKQIDEEISRLEKEQQDDALFSLDAPRSSHAASTSKPSKAASRSREASQTKKPNTSKQRVKRVVVEDVDVTEPTSVNTEDTRDQTGADEDLTLLSFIDGNEIAQLRKTLEEERAARKQRLSAAVRDHTADESRNATRPAAIPSRPRKSSLKETKPSFTRRASTGDATGKTIDDGNKELRVPTVSERHRRHSDNSVSTVRRRRPTNNGEMTSAFIIPDITLHHSDPELARTEKLSESAKRVLDTVAKHDGTNCTICKRFIPSGVEHSHGDSYHRESVTIPRPVPVSDRIPMSNSYNEEHTLRPSQPPAIALATVLKTLEDELSHLKMLLARYQAAYNRMDASLSKRQRKKLYERIENTLKDIDSKSDQIYALYDVLEGQKQNGQLMTEQELEVTLQSIGINVDQPAPGADNTGLSNGSSKRNVGVENDDDYDPDEDDELPWEGIESTGEVTGRSFGGRRDI
ncbi:hypothetical protein DTO027B5_1422 [Paecilomyces variotii]|nr:hypothetical protein DTO021C3_2176 [Paecilomyces variotii]KAJ9328797.1 hypothetical protein DTO027B3_1063 [Paecilomyces variotii]KAJ9336887.1 hypothetical protein DTO027B5_1422 [Paecilomyces variotii]KAJ9395694.1 hypothetical protein DTO282F9_7440 [Paecilomyces variotii]